MERLIALESVTREMLEAAVLQFNAFGASKIGDRLMTTLDVDPEVDEAWAAEVERRQCEIENGTISLHPGPETLANLKAEFE